MKLKLLGTTGYHPNALRHTACFLLPELGILFDAGTGMFRLRENLQTNELDIFLTHAHLDHIIGLTFLLDQLAGREMERVTIHGRPQDLEAVQTHLFAESLFPVKPPWEFQPLNPSGCTVAGSGRMMTFPLEHPGGAVGYRIDWPDRSLAYVTDTTADLDAPYVKRLFGVDLLIHECYFADDMADWARKTGHSWTTAVAEVARASHVQKLLLVHLDPLKPEVDPINVAAAREIFPETILGEDLLEVEF